MSDQQSRPEDASWLCATPCANSLSGAICASEDQCRQYRADGEHHPGGALAIALKEIEDGR